MLAEAVGLGVAAGRQQPDRDGPDFNHSGRRWRVKNGDHAKRHQRALVAIHGHGFIRAACHVGGHFRHLRSHLRRYGRSHAHTFARIGRSGKRREHEPCDHEDRQQPAGWNDIFTRAFSHVPATRGTSAGSLIRQNFGWTALGLTHQPMCHPPDYIRVIRGASTHHGFLKGGQ